jgi:uncharacterized membrane protein YcfT
MSRDFFLISGLFLAARIDRPWQSYLDSKAVHFAYFYILWMTIQFVVRGPGLFAQGGAELVADSYIDGFIEPFGTLWFIYMLAVFFVVTKLVRGLPPAVVLLAAAALEIAPIHTGHLLIDEFASRYVYFFAGYRFAPVVFAYAAAVSARALPVIAAGLAIWAFANGLATSTGLAFLPGFGLLFGFIGAAAVVSMGVLLARLPLTGWVRYCGENSIVIYLAFFLFMAATRAALLKSGLVTDLGMVSLIVTAAGVAGPVVLHWLTRNTPLAFLWRRPAWARLKPLAVDVVGGNRREVHNV